MSSIDDLLSRLIPLFEKTIQFKMTMMERTLSLEEKKEANKTELAYRTLEAKIENDKDSLKWEKEKLGLVIDSNEKIQMLKNTGDLDVEKLRGQVKEKEIAGMLQAKGIEAGTERYKAVMTAIPALISAGKGTKVRVPDASSPSGYREEVSEGSKEAGIMANTLGRQAGLLPEGDGAAPAVTGTSGVNDDVARAYAMGIESTRQTLGDEKANEMFRGQPPEMQQAILRYQQSLRPAFPVANAVAPTPTVATSNLSGASAANQTAAGKSVLDATKINSPTQQKAPEQYPLDPAEIGKFASRAKGAIPGIVESAITLPSRAIKPVNDVVEKAVVDLGAGIGTGAAKALEGYEKEEEKRNLRLRGPF